MTEAVAHPPPHNLHTVCWLLFLVLASVDDRLGVDDIADRLGHLATLLVCCEPVNQQSPERINDKLWRRTTTLMLKYA